jgi:GNAT superfamily N-acetyltransferase
MQIRTLTLEDAPMMQALRLRSLQEHPSAFGSAYEDEAKFSLETVADRLRASPDQWMLGAWIENQLAGMLNFHRNAGRKRRHRGGLGAMYVAPEFRGRGIGRGLLAEAIRQARTLPGLEELTLAVTVGNETAKALYGTAGFVSAYVEHRYIKIGEEYFDIEWMTLRL